MPIAPNYIRDWTIYKITNPESRVYIGVTSNVKLRFSHYRRKNSTSQPLINRSLIKYGVDNHTFEYIEQFTSGLDFAMGKELFWIKTYMSNMSKYPEIKGMNLTDGGQGGLGMAVSEKTRKILSEKNKGYKHTTAAIKKISEASIRSNTGKKLSEVTKQKLREANLGKKYSQETKDKLSALRQGKKIKSGWTEEKRQKMRETKLASNFRHTEETKKIIGKYSLGNKNCLGRKLSDSHKEKIRIASTGKKYSLGRKQSQEEKDKRGALFMKPILQYDLNGNFIAEYPNAKEAVLGSNVCKWTIRASIKNITKNPTKFIFKFK